MRILKFEHWLTTAASRTEVLCVNVLQTELVTFFSRDANFCPKKTDGHTMVI